MASTVRTVMLPTLLRRSRPGSLSDPYARFKNLIRKDTKMDDYSEDFWQNDVEDFVDPWEIEGEVIMAQWDEPDFW